LNHPSQGGGTPNLGFAPVDSDAPVIDPTKIQPFQRPRSVRALRVPRRQEGGQDEVRAWPAAAPVRCPPRHPHGPGLGTVEVQRRPSDRSGAYPSASTLTCPSRTDTPRERRSIRRGRSGVRWERLPLAQPRAGREIAPWGQRHLPGRGSLRASPRELRPSKTFRRKFEAVPSGTAERFEGHGAGRDPNDRGGGSPRPARTDPPPRQVHRGIVDPQGPEVLGVLAAVVTPILAF
jgi:hypothetical protein